MYQDKKRIEEDKKIAAIVEKMKAATKNIEAEYAKIVVDDPSERHDARLKKLVELEAPFRRQIDKIIEARRKREGWIQGEAKEPKCDW